MRCLLTLAVLASLVLLPGLALAQEASDQPTGVAKVFDRFVVDGGLITWFVLIPLSVATIALTIEHSLSIRRATMIPEAEVHRLDALLQDRQYAEALQLAAEGDSMIAQAVQGGLAEASHGLPAMEQAVEETIDERAGRLSRKIEPLNVIGNISPMIGLFGTVLGMILAFASIGDLGDLKGGKIADDIRIALVTTFWGLLVAIPALTACALFRNRIEALSAECEMEAERLLAVFKPGAAAASGTGVARTGPARTAPADEPRA